MLLSVQPRWPNPAGISLSPPLISQRDRSSGLQATVLRLAFRRWKRRAAGLCRGQLKPAAHVDDRAVCEGRTAHEEIALSHLNALLGHHHASLATAARAVHRWRSCCRARDTERLARHSICRGIWSRCCVSMCSQTPRLGELRDTNVFFFAQGSVLACTCVAGSKCLAPSALAGEGQKEVKGCPRKRWHSSRGSAALCGNCAGSLSYARLMPAVKRRDKLDGIGDAVWAACDVQQAKCTFLDAHLRLDVSRGCLHPLLAPTTSSLRVC